MGRSLRIRLEGRLRAIEATLKAVPDGQQVPNELKQELDDVLRQLDPLRRQDNASAAHSLHSYA